MSGGERPSLSVGGLHIEIEGASRRRLHLEALAAGSLVCAVLVGLWVYRQGNTPRPPAVTPPGTTDVTPSGWTLTFADEFDGTTLDTTRWIDSYPDGKRTHSNNEQQYYATDGWQVSGGFLRLTAERKPNGGMPYTSGMVCSYGKFAQKYGRFEIRARFPKGKGMWPAFWLLPESKGWPPEIDVLEILGDAPDVVLMSNHWGTDYRNHRWETGKWKGPDFSTDFHTFTVEWSPERIVWLVDGVERYRTVQNIPHEPMFVLANLAVGGDLPGMPDETTPFPGMMEVDYIRVYARADSAQAPPR